MSWKRQKVLGIPSPFSVVTDKDRGGKTGVTVVGPVDGERQWTLSETEVRGDKVQRRLDGSLKKRRYLDWFNKRSFSSVLLYCLFGLWVNSTKDLKESNSSPTSLWEIVPQVLWTECQGGWRSGVQRKTESTQRPHHVGLSVSRNSYDRIKRRKLIV